MFTNLITLITYNSMMDVIYHICVITVLLLGIKNTLF